MIGFLFLKIFQINIKIRLKTILTKLGIINWKLIIINPYMTQHVDPTKDKTHNFIGINLKFLNFTTFLITKIGSKEQIIEHTTHTYPTTSLLLINTANKKYIIKVNVNKIKEDMLYYCSSADILSKLDTNNSEYLFQESDFSRSADIFHK